MYSILIIEDNKKIQLDLAILLEKNNYEVVVPPDFSDTINFALTLDPHLVIIDLDLVTGDGLQTCQAIRRQSKVPIIVLAGSPGETDELMSTILGADHFMVIPYNPDVLLAKIAGLLYRTHDVHIQQSIHFGNLMLDIGKSEVRNGERSVELTKNELRILWMLLEREGGIVYRSEIMKAIWRSDTFVDNNTLTVSVNRLRKKLREIGAVDALKTRRGFGYCL
jgi:DNA-binding response OmpR family regulator